MTPSMIDSFRNAKMSKSQFGQKSSALFLASASVFISSLFSLFIPAAFALPELAVKRKLETVVVYVAAENGGLVVFKDTQDSSRGLAPLFLDEKDANKYLSVNGKKSDLIVVPLLLTAAMSVVENIRRQVPNEFAEIKSQIVPTKVDRLEAQLILTKEGVPNDQILKGLRVPVFFTEPMIKLETSAGQRQLFFMSHAQLKDFIGKMPSDQSDKLVVRVADLNAVMKVIADNSKDLYLIYPSQELIDANPGMVDPDL